MEEDYQYLLVNVRCVKFIMNNKYGLETVISLELAVERLVFLIDTEYYKLTTTALQLLCAICIFSTTGHKY